MIAMTAYEFIHLLPILILGLAIVILLCLLLLFRINTKLSVIFTVVCLSFTLMTASFIGYQIISYANDPSLIPNNEVPNIGESVIGENSDELTETPLELASSSSSKTEEESQVLALDVTKDHYSNDQGITDAVTVDDTVISEQKTEQKKILFWQASYVTTLFTSDGYGSLYTSLILFLSIAVATLAFKWFKNEQNEHGLFYLMVLFSAFGGVTLIYASHLISLFIGIELLSIPAVGLIGYQYTKKCALEATIKYMVLSIIASTFLLLGIAFYYAATGELTFSGLSFQLSTLTLPSTLLLLGVCLMLVGIGFKLSFVPFQLWLPDVYQGTSACICLLLTTINKVAIFCVVARLFLLSPIVNNETIRIIMVIMAFCSIVWGNIASAMAQHNMKRLLAYCSISHFGYLLIALISVQYQVLALETIGVYLIGYVLANICVFGGMSLESCSSAKPSTKSYQDNEIDLSGLFWRRPIIALAMGIGLLSLAGIPLTVGFIGRFSLMLLGVTAELWWLVGALVIGSAFGLYCHLRLVINLYLKPNGMNKSNVTVLSMAFRCDQVGINEIYIVGSALLILLCGIYPQWLFDLVSIARYLIPH